MAIYGSLRHADVTVGTGGRLTIPHSMRQECGIQDGDKLTVRMDQGPRGVRRLVLLRKERDEDD